MVPDEEEKKEEEGWVAVVVGGGDVRREVGEDVVRVVGEEG